MTRGRVVESRARRPIANRADEEAQDADLDHDARRDERAAVGRFVFMVPAMAERLCRGAGFELDRIDEQVNGRDFLVVYRRPQ